MQEEQLLDYGDYPRINSAGLADWHILPDGRVRFIMFDWERDRGVWRRRVSGIVTRTTHRLREDHMRFWGEIEHGGLALH